MEEQKKSPIGEDTKEEGRCESKKMKNLVSLVILLVGLFIGSLFVDVGQIIKGGGFSQKNLNKSDVFMTGDKTWVAYNDPVINIKVLTDSDCEECDPSEVLIWLRRVLPTVNATKIEVASEEGKKIASDFQIKSIPAFIFPEKIAETEFYFQAQPIFEQVEDEYLLKSQELGLAPGKYLVSPEIREDDTVFGNKDSEVKVVIFSDYQCPYCKLFWNALRKNMQDFGEQVLFDYKHLPLDIHPQANNAALAAECANDQNKFWEYGDTLFDKQTDWQDTTGTGKFKEYAKELKLDVSEFNQCLDGKKYQDKIVKDIEEAREIGIAGTPAIFVNEQFRGGALSSPEFKSLIESEINK